MATSLITCRELVERATHYMELALAPEARREVEAHLAGCPHCRTYLEQLDWTIRLLGTLREQSAALPPHIADHMRQLWRQVRGTP